MSLIFNGIEPNNVIWNGIETTGIYNGETLWGSQPYYNLTLQTDGHGTLTASVLTGYPGDTVTLSPTYNTYYRFNNYSVTGGTIANNTFTFGNEDATAQANFKVNYFTATGNFEKGSNITANSNNSVATTQNIPTKYALHQSHTGDIPASWYATSNRWKPNDASGYSITLNPKMKFEVTCPTIPWKTGAMTAISLLGSTATQSQSWSTAYAANVSKAGTTAYNYNKTFTSNVQNINYGISGKLYSYAAGTNKVPRSLQVKYIATGTTGTWTATGIAP